MYVVTQIRDLVFRLKYSLHDVEKLSQHEAGQLLRGEEIDADHIVQVDNNGIDIINIEADDDIQTENVIEIDDIHH